MSTTKPKGKIYISFPLKKRERECSPSLSAILIWRKKQAMVKSLPVSLAKGVQPKLISNLSGIHSIWKILLVSKHKQHSIT
jgi:hypothetical protein